MPMTRILSYAILEVKKRYGNSVFYIIGASTENFLIYKNFKLMIVFCSL